MAGEENSEAMNSLDESSGNKITTDETPAARRARLRPSLSKQDPTADPQQAAVSASPGPSTTLPLADAVPSPNQGASDLRKRGGSAAENPSIVNVHARRGEASGDYESTREASEESSPMVLQGPPTGYSEQTISPKAAALVEQSFAGGIQDKVSISSILDTLHSIDQAMAACATNLAALERVAQEESLAIKALNETLQKQTFTELGLNLNSLMDSFTTALEPMKAAGELVPAIDQLVSAIQGSDTTIGERRLSKEQLVVNLAEQLANGHIDPITFKCASVAIFRDVEPTALLDKLTDLLGAQMVTGDVFQAAFQAIQGSEVPTAQPSKTSRRRSDRAAKKEDNQTTETMDSTEMSGSTLEESEPEAVSEPDQPSGGEFIDSLAHKQLLESQELMDSKLQELDNRYRELEALLQEREGELKQKSIELSHKDSENQQLKAQMEELRDQTKDLVADLQKQLTQTKDKETPPVPAKPAPGFFDIAAGQSTNLFENQPSKSLFQQEVESPIAPGSQSELRQSADFAMPNPSVDANLASKAPPQPFGVTVSGTHPLPSNPMSNNPQVLPHPTTPQPMPARPTTTSNSPITTPMAPGPGSYGSGVRAQVFEVIVRQALAGAPWQDICSGPMQVNNISAEEVETEVKRRQALLKK